jgi:hypothetical protein
MRPVDPVTLPIMPEAISMPGMVSKRPIDE